MSLSITVIIPTIDSLSTLPTLIEIILPQLNRERDELLFLDTESIDGTREYIEEVDFPRKKIITIRRGAFSHGSTRMRGAEAASGDIIVFFTDDIVPIGDTFLEELVRPVIEGRAAAACGVSQIDPERGDPLRARRYNSWYLKHPDSVGPLSTEQWNRLSPYQPVEKPRNPVKPIAPIPMCGKLILSFHNKELLPYGDW